MSAAFLGRLSGAAAIVLGLSATGAAAWVEAPGSKADATIDLRTQEGASLAQATWRYSDARILEVSHRDPGPDNKPSGPPNRTWDFTPHAGAADFDDTGWPEIDPTSLEARRGGGRLSFNWYRIRVTIPERIGGFSTAGSTAVFQIVVDDYAEVWVDGQLPRELGQSGGSLVRGWNAPNRVVVSTSARPGQQVQLAVFGINGPISDTPSNFIWVRDARLDFYRMPRAVPPHDVPLEIVRLDAGLDAIVPEGARLEKLAEGFDFTEGPVWVPGGEFLLFSDPNRNRIYRWRPEGKLELFREQSGYDAPDIGEYHQPGSNGLTLDAQGRLTIDEHGRHRVSRLEPDGRVTVLAADLDGARLNSPNDLVYRSDGTLYFTDPPFGLPRFHEDPRRQLPFTGVFALRDGRLRPVSKELTGPNGLAFSPDERFLYVTNWDEKAKVVTRYEVERDGGLSHGRVLYDMGKAPEPEALDGIKVDTAGNLYVSGPGGLWILSADGVPMGILKTPELAANFAWGDDDGRTLYLTARTGLYRLRLKVPGIRPMAVGRLP